MNIRLITRKHGPLRKRDLSRRSSAFETVPRHARFVRRHARFGS
jgi:hypothetical protein